MGQMLIRNIDDLIIECFKARAAENRTSAEEEARRALAASAGFDAQAWLAGVEAFAARLGPQTGPSSTEMLRADRHRDDDA